MFLNEFTHSGDDILDNIDWDSLIQKVTTYYNSIADSSTHHKKLKQCHFSIIEHLIWQRNQLTRRIDVQIDDEYDARSIDALNFDWSDDPFEEQEMAMFLANRAYDKLTVIQSHAHFEEQLYRAFADAIRKANEGSI